jgi:predicted nucleic acid-binding protein
VRPIFAAIAEGTLSGVTSVLTLLEILVQPYRVGNAPLAENYQAFVTRSHGLRMDPITDEVLRAAHNIKTPDALHLATALTARCPVYWTKDRNLPPIPVIRILQIRNYLSASQSCR